MRSAMRSGGVSRGAIVAAAAAFAVVAVVGVVALVARSDGSDTSPTARRPVPASGDSAALGDEGSQRPDGLSRDEVGAVAAAVEYVTAPQEWLYLSDEQVRTAASDIVVPDERGEREVDHIVEELAVPREGLESATGVVWFVVSPLATKVEHYSPDRATVAVWRVAVLSADDVAMPHAGWQTVTVELEWHGDWLLAASHETDGPVPQLAPSQQPWSARYLDEELEGFQRVGVSD
jgi:hypothetical protein